MRQKYYFLPFLFTFLHPQLKLGVFLYNLVNHFFKLRFRNSIIYTPLPLHFSVTVHDKTDYPSHLKALPNG